MGFKFDVEIEMDMDDIPDEMWAEIVKQIVDEAQVTIAPAAKGIYIWTKDGVIREISLAHIIDQFAKTFEGDTSAGSEKRFQDAKAMLQDGITALDLAWSRYQEAMTNADCHKGPVGSAGLGWG